MINKNDLKTQIIIDNKKRYEYINQRIIQVDKLYFKTMKNHSFQITQIENKINEYNIKSNIKIKQLLQNQQNLIKDLIKIINQILLHKEIAETTSTGNENISSISSIRPDSKINNKKNFQNMKKDIPLINSCTKNKMLNGEKGKLNKNNYPKKANNNKPINSNNRNQNNRNNKINELNKNKFISLNIVSLKSINDLKNGSDIFNIKNFNKNQNKSWKKLLNKEQIKQEIESSNKQLFKSASNIEISNNPKITNNTFYLKTNSFTNSIPSYFNGNYTIDEERNNTSLNYGHERQTSHDNKTFNEGNLPNLFSKRNLDKKVNYRRAKNINLKEEFYLINNYTFTNFNITNNSSYKSTSNPVNTINNSIVFFKSDMNKSQKNTNSMKKLGKRVYSMPYINNGIQIIPTRNTKEVLCNSYKIVKKYKSKINKLRKYN